MAKWRLPRATTAEREALTPDASELIYDETEEKVYYGDGATAGGKELGAGAGVYGFGFYEDTAYTTSSRQSFPANTRTLLENDAATANTSNLQAPFDSHTFVSGDMIQANSANEAYLVRVTFDGQSSIANAHLTLEVDIGGSVGVIQADRQDFDPAAGTDRSFTFNALIFTGSTFVANGAGIYLTSDQNATIYNTKFLIIPVFA